MRTPHRAHGFLKSASVCVLIAGLLSPLSRAAATPPWRTGVPHLTGTTRCGTGFGAGHAAAEGRLWLMDVFRNVGRGRPTAFTGGAAANQGPEQELWRDAPCSEADLRPQIDGVTADGERSRRALTDVNAQVVGIDADIAAFGSGRHFPGEYAAGSHRPRRSGRWPRRASPTDLRAEAVLPKLPKVVDSSP
ncbi:penicillin acylase family protein [Streptomyces sp. NPDC086077]|uniref:penicillin acylase family protein n=1 Tax=Streptomyces sp. NPDC086077 TaxID=3154862 RepID=UPI0034154A3E